MLKCPFTRLDLLSSLSTIPEDIMTDENGIKLQQLCRKYFPESIAEKKKLIAEENGITVIDLINTPNYDRLVEEYEVCSMGKMVIDLKTIFEFTDEQAWGIMMTLTGSLKEGDI